ncbi:MULTISPECIES: PulJ/GspJ family protein [Lysinibacillus]|uniref:PulJ/GspJ family protein n=1 Tax=Lysinibacillus TaxID=400634 RepID=UPI00257AD8B7|nr:MULTISPECIES: type II secretion system protein [Lysinibacillus]
MKKTVKLQHGMTLVEVLAVLVIVSIISVLLFNILGSSTSTHQKQSTKNEELRNASYALKLITKDFRRARNFDESTYTFTIDSQSYVYTISNNTITRNGETVANNIESFSLSYVNNILTVNLKSQNGKEISTNLSLRKGKSS